MKKYQPIPVGPPSTDADALIDSLGLTKEEKERMYRTFYSGKRGSIRQKKGSAGKVVDRSSGKSASKHSRKNA